MIYSNQEESEIETSTPNREALTITKKEIKLKLAEAVSDFQVIGSHQQNYVVNIRLVSSYKRKLSLISLQGDELLSCKTQDSVLSAEMATQELVFILAEITQITLKAKLFGIIQWDLSKNQVTKVELKIKSLFVDWPKMFIFPESSLICFCISAPTQVPSRQGKRFLNTIFIRYYKYPFKEENNQPINQYSFLVDSQSRVWFQKLNQQSKVGVYQLNALDFYTYSLQKRLQFYTIKIQNSSQREKAQIIQIHEVKPENIFVKVKQNNGFYSEYLLVKEGIQITQKILPTSNRYHYMQFRDCLKRVSFINYEYISREYVDPDTLEVFVKVEGKTERDGHWQVATPAYDANIEIWSHCQNHCSALLFEELRLTELCFDMKTIYTFLMLGFLPTIDEDLIDIATELILSCERY